MKREVALRGGLEKARERKEGVMAERRRHREDEAVVGMEELSGWIVGGGGGGRRGEEAVESDEKRVRCFGLPRRRGEEAHLARRRRRRSGRRGGDGNGSKGTQGSGGTAQDSSLTDVQAHTSVTKAAPVARILEVGDGATVWGPHGSEMRCRTQLSEREREKQIGAARTFHLSLLTERQRVRLVWRATSVNVVKM